MQPGGGHFFRLPVWLALVAVLLAGTGNGEAKSPARPGVMKTYRTMMARNCRITQKKQNTGDSIFNRNIRLSEQWIRIRHVQKGWKGWVRVHVVCRVPGGTAWGYADLQLKSGQIKCESGNWDSMITPPLGADR